MSASLRMGANQLDAIEPEASKGAAKCVVEAPSDAFGESYELNP
jgi:hypothetical protein